MISTHLGIEISGKDLRLAIVRRTFRKLRLLKMDQIEGFTDLPIEEQRTSLRALIKKQNVSAGRAFLTLPRDRGIVRQIEFPVEVRENLKSAIQLQLEALCPWTADEIYWDFSYREPRSGAKTIIVTVVVIPRVNVDPWMELFRSVELSLSGAALAPASCANAIYTLWPDSGSVVALDCESGYVDGVLIHSGHLTSLRETGEDVSATAQTAVAQLASSGRVESADALRLVAYGSAVQLLEREEVRLPIEGTSAATSDRFGVIASALAGIRKTGFDCNVIPPELRFRRSQLQLVPTYILVLLAILLGSAMALREPYQYTRYAGDLEREIRVVAPQAREVSAQSAELDRLALKYRALLANLQNKDYGLESLRELAVALPPTAWLTSYSYQDGVIMVSGIAPSASEVQKLLEDSPWFKDVQFTSSIARDADGKERFSLKAAIEVPR